jgi:ribosomal protein S21
MTIVIEIKKNQTENAASVIRRFSRRVQESGIIQRVKGRRYHERPQTKLAQKASALKRLTRKKEFERLKKLGKAL